MRTTHIYMINLIESKVGAVIESVYIGSVILSKAVTALAAGQ